VPSKFVSACLQINTPITMALVNVTNVIVLDNPTVFSNDFQFEVRTES